LKAIKITVLAIALTSCSLFDEQEVISSVVKDENGVIIQNYPVWSTELVTSKQTGKLIPSFIYPIIYENHVTYPSGDKSDGNWDLVAMNISDGVEKWRWTSSEILDRWSNKRNAGLSLNTWVQLDDGFTSEEEVVDIFGINVATGTTSFRYKLEGESLNDDAITHKGKYYFHYFPANDSEYGHTMRPIIFEGDVQTGLFEELLIPRIDSVRLHWTGDLGHVRGITAFEGSDGHDYLLIPFGENQIEDGPEYTWTWGHLFIGLYDLTDRKYVYEKMPITENAYLTFDAQGARIFQNRIAILTADHQAFGVDLFTGEILWKRKFSDGGISFIISDSVLVLAKSSGLDETTFGLDPETGSILWTLQTSTGCDNISALNGVVYWVDRGDGKLYAIEAATGTLLWRLADPDPEENSWWRQSGIAVLPEGNENQGRIFAGTDMRLYCFEAAR